MLTHRLDAISNARWRPTGNVHDLAPLQVEQVLPFPVNRRIHEAAHQVRLRDARRQHGKATVVGVGVALVALVLLVLAFVIKGRGRLVVISVVEKISHTGGARRGRQCRPETVRLDLAALRLRSLPGIEQLLLAFGVDQQRVPEHAIQQQTAPLPLAGARPSRIRRVDVLQH